MRNHQPAARSIVTTVAGATALALTLLVSACATLPVNLPSAHAVGDKARAQATADWNATPALTARYIDKPALLSDAPGLPTDVAGKKVTLALPQKATVAGFAALLDAMGVPTLIRGDGLAAQTLGLSRYHGRLGGLLQVLAANAPLAFTWRNGVLAIAPARPMIAYLPQNKDLIKAMAKDLAGLGATHITTSRVAGSVSFDAPGAATWRLRHYIKRVVGNAATVALQVAVVVVGLSKERDTGLDWSRLQLTLGHDLGLDFGAGSGSGGTITPVNPGSGLPGQNGGGTNNGNGYNTGGNYNLGSNRTYNNGSGVGGNGNAGASMPIGPVSKLGGGLAKQTLGVGVSSYDFNLQALFSLLSSYGNTRTTQNLVLRALSGQQVKIRSGQTVPYVSGVSVNANNNGGLLGGTQTDTVETGLTLKITPQFNARSQLVTMAVDLQLKSITGFLQLNAGNQVGNLSRPDVQDQSLKTVARANAGQTVVLGGLIYDQLSDNRNSLAGLENLPIAHKKKQLQRKALFIIIRPTVTTYDFSDT